MPIPTDKKVSFIKETEILMESKKVDKYRHIKRAVVADVDFEVTEYVAPGEEVGYQIIIHKESEGMKYTMSRGYGVESKSRTWDWTKVGNPEDLIKYN